MTRGKYSRRNGRNISRLEWGFYFRAVMDAGILICFSPDCNNLAKQFGHIRPEALGGRPTMDNIACTCRPCEIKIGNQDWTGKICSYSECLGKELGMSNKTTLLFVVSITCLLLAVGMILWTVFVPGVVLIASLINLILGFGISIPGVIAYFRYKDGI